MTIYVQSSILVHFWVATLAELITCSVKVGRKT